MPGLQAALFPRGPSLFTPVTCLTAAPLSCLTTQTSLELKSLPVYHPAFIFHLFPVTCFFPPSFSTTPISKLSPANSLLHSYTLGSILTAMLERPFWKTLRVTSAGWKWVRGHAVAQVPLLSLCPSPPFLPSSH